MLEPDDKRDTDVNTASAHEQHALGAPLDRVVQVMRTDVPLSGDWRDALLRQLASEPRPSSIKAPLVFRRSIHIAPITAIAACLVAMAAGAGGVSLVNRAEVASAPAGQLSKPTVSLVPASRNVAGRTTIRFALVAPGAAHVSVVGDFNGWDANATPMQPVRDGRTWLIDMPLSAGRHAYAFVVDGDLVADPSAPRAADDDYGAQNSVVLVGAAGP